MNILLMTPTISKDEKRPEVIGISKNQWWSKIRDKFGFAPGITPSYGLLYLATILQKEGHNPYYLDGSITNIQTVIDCIIENNIKVVGISTLSFNWERAKLNIKTLRQKFPSIKIMIGGIHASCLMETCLKESPETDILVYGEAEESIIEVVNRIETKKGLNGTLGTLYRENGRIVKNGDQPINNNLNSYPFPNLDILGNNLSRFRPAPMFYRKLPHASIFASRGCPYSCTFCLSNRKFRKRSPQNVVDEIEMYVKKYNVKSITFYDETLTLHKKWLKEICKEIVNRKLKIEWSANVRADCIDKEILEIMKESGCWQTLFGIESGVQKNLNKITKGISLEKIQEGVELANTMKIEALGMFMFGIPGESYEEGLLTIDFARKLPLSYAIFTNITPFPGTALYEEVKNHKGFKGINNLTPLKMNYVPDSMTEEELQSLLKLAYRKFYYRPSYIYNQLLRMKSLEDVKKNIRGFIQLWS